MSDLTPCTRLSDEQKAALLLFLNSRTVNGERFRQMGIRVFHYRGDAVIRTYGEVDEDLNLLALITGAMAPEELTAYVREMASAHDAVKYSNSGYVTWARFLLTADAPTRATAALLAILKGEVHND